MNDIVYTRRLSKKEAEQLNIEKMEAHEWCKDETLTLSEENFAQIYDDIMKNGMTEPITLLDGKILDGIVRRAVIVGEDIKFDIPFEEYIGPKDKATVKEWVWRKNIVRTQAKTTALAVHAVEDWISHFDELKKAKMITGEIVIHAARKVGVGVDSVRKARRIKRKNLEIYNFMKLGLITIEEALRIIDKCETLSEEWLDKIYKWMNKNGGDFEKAIEAAKAEKEQEQFDKINAEYNQGRDSGRSMIKPSKYKGKKLSIVDNSKKPEKARLTLSVDRIEGESVKQYNERIQKMADDLNDILAVYGITNLYLVKSNIAKRLFDGALYKAQKIKGVKSVAIKERPISEKEPDEQNIIHIPYAGDIIE